MEIKTKQPGEVDDFDVDFTRRLGSDDTVLSMQAFVVDGDEFLFIEKTSVIEGVRGKVWLSGGTNKTTYKITGYGVTQNGRVIEFDFLMYVRDE